MEKLNEIWGDNDMEGLPFSTNVNEKLVLDVIKDLHSKKILNRKVYEKVKQWIKFNYYFNEVLDESSLDYKNYVHRIYSQINNLFINCGFETIDENFDTINLKIS